MSKWPDKYPSNCRIQHAGWIGYVHTDWPDDERCPVCRLMDEAEFRRAALAAAEDELAQTGGELGIMKNQNTMLKAALADERRNADAGYRALDELATFTLEDFPNLDARHPKACVTPAYRNANIAAVDHLKAHVARRAAEVANGA